MAGERPTLTITIEGAALTGKTTLAALLTMLLRELGMTFEHIKYECPLDADHLHYEHVLDGKAGDLVKEAMQRTLAGAEVVIREVHLNRAGRRIG